MGVSKNRGTPNWMVYNGNPIKMDDLGVPLFSETPILSLESRSVTPALGNSRPDSRVMFTTLGWVPLRFPVLWCNFLVSSDQKPGHLLCIGHDILLSHFCGILTA